MDLSSHVEVLGRLKSYTITAWVRDPENMIFAISCGARRGYRIQFERYQDLLVYGWQNGGPWDAIDAVVDGWQPGRWYHVAVTVSGGNVALYRDGEPLIGPRHTGTRMSTSVQRPFDLKWKTDACIGKVARLGENQYLNGQVDDLQVYRQALDAEAIRYLFEHPGAVVDDDYYSEVKGRP